jgi:uncharacterized protein YjgD (DUF1641 family)
MALPIPFESPKRDPREELRARLEQAVEHAEAILASFEVLQGLHDDGVLELLRGVLGGGDKVLGVVVDAVKTPEAIRGLRSLITILKLLGSVDPDQLHAALAENDKNVPSLWAIGKRATTKDARRGMATAVNLLNMFGAILDKQQGMKHE